ncbi:TolB family protein, partial [Promineifilum sp.]|uniref:TolB family protein n=1 Tax=Promineifilum sp. TaxID=2664178 RepID=UPI0035B478E9
MKRRLPFVLVFLALLLAEGVWLLADLRAAQTETPATQRLPPAVMSDSGDAAWASSTSADGRYIAFVSSAANLVAGDRDASPDIFVYDRQTGVMECVSVTSDEHDLESRFDAPSISDDGRYVVFEGWSYTLVPGSSGYVSEIYLHDRQTGATTLLTTSAIAEELIDGNSFDATISADGRYVVFASEATNLVSGDTNDAVDIFLHDVSAGGTRRVSLRGAATQAGGDSGAPTVSADGRFVAFHSDADSLVNGDTNNQSDVFVRNVAAGTTTRVSVGAGGAQGDGPSWQGVISDNGRYVAFESLAANFAADDDNDAGDVFIRDRQANTTALVSRDADGHPAA